MNLTDVVLHRARMQPDAIALIDGDQTVRYADLDRAIRIAAAALAERGVGENSVVAMEVRSVPLHLIMALAVARLRAISTPVPDGTRFEQRVEILRRFGAKFFIGEKFFEGLDGFEFIVADASLAKGRVPADDVGHRPAAERLAWRIHWSSGTTGTPKAIVATHRQMVQRLLIEQSGPQRYGPGTVLYPGVGIKIAFALNQCLRVLVAGGTVVCHAPAGSETFAHCERHGVTHFLTSPAIASRLAAMVQEDRPRLPGVTLLLGGGLVMPPLRERLMRRFTPHIGIYYGSTETGTIAFAEPADYAAHPETVGRVAQWMQVETVDENDQPQPAGKVGRIRVRGVAVAQRYVNSQAATAEVFRDGWFYPGDLGRLTPDGLLKLEGRLSEVLNAGGTKVAPEVIEEVLARHPGVADVAAFMANDPAGHPWLVAAVVPRGELDHEALLRAAREQLGNGAPAAIVAVQRIPRTDMGKIKRAELAETVVVDPKPARTLH